MRQEESSRIARASRVFFWNAALFLVGIGAIAVVHEAWFRFTSPFPSLRWPLEFVSGVGRHPVSNAEVRWTNGLDYWTVAETNSWGFLDREPESLERAAAGCHVAFVGDSFVEAVEVPIADKFHVRLEALASERLPRLDVATSAYGRKQTGQIAQLSFYDKWIRRVQPKLLVLVFVGNDFRENSRSWPNLLAAVEEDDGRMALRAPSIQGYEAAFRDRPWRTYCVPRPVLCGRLLRWLDRRPWTWRRPWTPPWDRPGIARGYDFTGFALDHWKQRAEDDGFALAVLTNYDIGTRGHPFFEVVSRLAEARDVPVIDQSDYILRQGARIEDARWKHDYHWNRRGHQWAAEAVLEWLEQNQSVCGQSPA